jgi:hypothetical protein
MDRRGRNLGLVMLAAACAAPRAAAPAGRAQAEPAPAASESAELAKKLSNPVAALISVPLQFNYDQDLGPTDDGEKLFVNVQPVIPISLSSDWNLISRTILPVVLDQDDVVPGTDQSGLGDVLQSAFFSPGEPTKRGWSWGAGPVLLLPTATDERLGGEKWGAGPTAVGLRQIGPWTYGALANHVWSFAGDDERSDVNVTFLQPFLAHSLKTATTFTLNTESTYDWEGDEWSVPVNVLVGQILKLGRLPVQFSAGARYWFDSPPGGPEGWGARFQIAFLFPR